MYYSIFHLYLFSLTIYLVALIGHQRPTLKGEEGAISFVLAHVQPTTQGLA